jgi:trk system potassium uptake protein TrkH
MSISGILHIQGLLLLFCAAAMLLPLPFSLYYGGGDAPALALSSGITAGAGFLLFLKTKLRRELRPRDGFAAVSFAWILFSLFGSLPFLLSGSIPTFTDAFFETISGFTTTGASILTDIEALPHGILFLRSLTHWLGGMGIIVLSLAILPALGLGGTLLFKAEVAGPTADKLVPRVAETAKILWVVYVVFTLAQTVLLMVGGMSLFDALCHSFGTLASGGFSTRNASVAAFGSAYIEWVCLLFMFIAGTNFALHYQGLRGRPLAYIRDREFHVYLASILILGTIVSIDVLRNYEADWAKGIRDSLFMVTSSHTSTGFATGNYELWSPVSQFAMIIAMLIGGSAGSTSGGLKVIRVYLVFKFISSEFTRLLHPQAVVPVRIHGKPVPREIITGVLGYVSLYFAAVVLGLFGLAATGLDINSALGAIVSCLGGVGPGLGSVGPVDNYFHLHPVAKWILSLAMLLGRLEFYSFLILFSPAYWKK